MKKIFYVLFFPLLLYSCLKEDSPFIPFKGIVPKNINDGWSISTPSNENVNEEALINVFKNIHDKGELFQIRSLLVFRNNKLIAETYFKDEDDIYNPRPIWSCTKQIISILTGVAIDNGFIDSINTPISNYLFSELQNHLDKANITISNLLTMRGGIAFDETKDVSAIMQNKPDNVIEFILSKPMLFIPGQTFSYNSGETHLLAACIQNSVNKPLQEWANDALFSKIGFNNYSWLKYDGYNFGGYGISTTPRELAKIGQFVLNKGNWNNEQIVDSSWVNNMIETQTATNSEGGYTFGNLWWINENQGIYFMAGSGGQYVVVIPDKNMIIVSMAEHDTHDDLEINFDTFLEIVTSIRQTAN